jgi:hypothetical protein
MEKLVKQWLIVKKTFKLPKRIETVMKIAITNKDREVSIAAALRMKVLVEAQRDTRVKHQKQCHCDKEKK